MREAKLNSAVSAEDKDGKVERIRGWLVVLIRAVGKRVLHAGLS